MPKPSGCIDEAIRAKGLSRRRAGRHLARKPLAWRGFGRFTYPPPDLASALSHPSLSHPDLTHPDLTRDVTRETVWDLASLTKPIATTSMAMLLCERGKLSLDATVADCSRSLPTAEPLHRGWREAGDGANVAGALLGTARASQALPRPRRGARRCWRRRGGFRSESAPMERAEYSDIGFIILGELLERIAGERLDTFCQREIFSPLHLNLSFVPQPASMMDVPPTINDTSYRGRIVQGEVNDENA